MGCLTQVNRTSIFGFDKIKLAKIENVKWQPFVPQKANDLNTKIQKKNMSKKFDVAVEKIYVSGGKEKGIRTLDIIGAFTSIEGVQQADIGVVEVLQKISYVEIFNRKANIIVEAMKHKTIKKKKVRVEIAK